MSALNRRYITSQSMLWGLSSTIETSLCGFDQGCHQIQENEYYLCTWIRELARLAWKDSLTFVSIQELMSHALHQDQSFPSVELWLPHTAYYTVINHSGLHRNFKWNIKHKQAPEWVLQLTEKAVRCYAGGSLLAASEKLMKNARDCR